MGCIQGKVDASCTLLRGGGSAQGSRRARLHGQRGGRERCLLGGCSALGGSSRCSTCGGCCSCGRGSLGGRCRCGCCALGRSGTLLGGCCCRGCCGCGGWCLCCGWCRLCSSCWRFACSGRRLCCGLWRLGGRRSCRGGRRSCCLGGRRFTSGGGCRLAAARHGVHNCGCTLTTTLHRRSLAERCRRLDYQALDGGTRTRRPHGRHGGDQRPCRQTRSGDGLHGVCSRSQTGSSNEIGVSCSSRQKALADFG